MAKKEIFKNESKAWYKSRTIWVNVLMALAAIFTDVSALLGQGGTFSAFAVMNIVLRVITKSAVATK